MQNSNVVIINEKRRVGFWLRYLSMGSRRSLSIVRKHFCFNLKFSFPCDLQNHVIKFSKSSTNYSFFLSYSRLLYWSSVNSQGRWIMHCKWSLPCWHNNCAPQFDVRAIKPVNVCYLGVSLLNRFTRWTSVNLVLPLLNWWCLGLWFDKVVSNIKTEQLNQNQKHLVWLE